MQTDICEKLGHFRMYIFIQCVLYLSVIPSESSMVKNNDKRLAILERKFVIQVHENALMQEEIFEIKQTLSGIENVSSIMSSDVDKKENEKENNEIEKVFTDSVGLPQTTATLTRLLQAFQVEKMERQDLQRELKQLEESYRFEKETMQSKINVLESNQQELEKLLNEQTKNGEREIKRISDKLAVLNESFLDLMDADLIRQVDNFNTKIDSVKEIVKANADQLAKSTEDQLSSVITNVTSISKHLRLRQVSFSAKLSDSISNLDPWTTLVFDDVITNIGNAYSGTTGVFTAPTNGVYLFYTHVLCEDRALEMCLQKNGKTVLWLYANGPGHGQDGNTVVLKLAKRDTVKVVKHGPWGSPPFYIHGVWTNIAGTMLYPL